MYMLGVVCTSLLCFHVSLRLSYLPLLSAIWYPSPPKPQNVANFSFFRCTYLVVFTCLWATTTRPWHDSATCSISELHTWRKWGGVSDFACARVCPDFSTFLCLWRKVTIGWEMRPVRLVLQNIRNFFSQNGWCLPWVKIVGPVRAAIMRKVQVRKVNPGGRLFATFTDVLRPLTSLILLTRFRNV